MTKEIQILRSGLKTARSARDTFQNTDNNDNHWNRAYEDLIPVAEDLDGCMPSDYSTLEDDLQNAEGDIDIATDMQDYYLEALDDTKDATADTFTARLPYIEGLAKIKYEDVLYICSYDDPGYVRETNRDEIMAVVNSIIDDIQARIDELQKKTI